MLCIADNLQTVHSRIQAAEQLAGRPTGQVNLLAVSKTQPAAQIRAAFEAGQLAFGENYVQEGVEKAIELRDLNLQWHFIGPLQSNKTRLVAQHFSWIHSIDRLKIAQRLAEQRDIYLPPLQICLQINVSGEESKSGIHPDELPELAQAVAALPRLNLRGLMCIPEPTEELAILRSRFALLRELKDSLNTRYNMALDTLSMGMSHDIETAILEGSTCVRVGTAIFGQR